MKNRFLTLVLSSFLFVILLGNWATVLAQSSDNSEEEFYFNPPTPLTIAFNPELDGETYRPANRQQSDLPFSEDERSIIGSDERAPMLSQAFPWSTIGRLEHFVPPNAMSTCTGTLIGEDLVLTNAHCVISNLEEGSGDFKEEMRFKLRLTGNRPLATAKVTEVVDIGTYTHIDVPMRNPDDDWAVLRIDQNLGQDFGYLGWRVLDFTDTEILESLEDQVRLAGYSFDFPTDKYRQHGRAGETAGVHAGCSIRGLSENFGIAINENASVGYDPTGTNVTEGILLHDCDSLQGSSGSALIALFDDGNYYIVGLHAIDFPVPSASPEHNPAGQCTLYRPNSSGEWDFREINGSCFNGAVQVSRWAEQAAEVRTEN